MPGSKRQNSMFEKTKGYVQKSNPFPVTSCGRRRNLGSPLKQDDDKCYIDDDGKSVCPPRSEEEKKKDQEKIEQQIEGTYVETEEDIKKRKEEAMEYKPKKK